MKEQALTTARSVSPSLSLPPFFLFLAIRIATSALLRTAFHPDEYFQTVEPAYHLAHVDSTCVPPLTWEWLPAYQLRSHISILPYYLLFLCHKYLYIYSPLLTTLLTPRVLQGTLAALSDAALHHLITDLNGPTIAWYTSWLNLGSWSLLFCLPRTLGNSTETVFCIVIAWLWRGGQKRYCRCHCHCSPPLHEGPAGSKDNTDTSRQGEGGNAFTARHNTAVRDITYSDKTLGSTRGEAEAGHLQHSHQYKNQYLWWEASASCLSATAVYSRPTSALLLAPLALLVLFLRLRRPSSYCSCSQSKHGQREAWYFILRGLLVATVTVVACVCLDIWGYRTLYEKSCSSLSETNWWRSSIPIHIPIPPWNFIRVNYVEDMSSRFGIQPWHWHLTQGLPTILGLYTVLFLQIAFRNVHNCYKSSPSLSFSLGLLSAKRREEFLLRSDNLMTFSCCTVALYVVAMSLSPHKEFRFLLPCLPPLHWYLAWHLHAMDTEAPPLLLSGDSSREQQDQKELRIHQSSSGKLLVRDDGRLYWCSHMYMTVVVVLVALHAAVALYLLGLHQAGTEQAFHVLRQDISEGYFALSQSEAPLPLSPWRASRHHFCPSLTVHLLAPCFSFPGISLLSPQTLSLPNHSCASVKLLSPTCSPHNSSAVSESHLFQENPTRFWNSKSEPFSADVSSNCHPKHTDDGGGGGSGVDNDRNNICDGGGGGEDKIWPPPDVVMTFDGYLTAPLLDALSSRGMGERARFHHAHFRFDLDDPDSKREVVMFYKEK